MVQILIYSLLITFLILFVLKCIVITKENHYSFITRFGKYKKTLTSGLGFIIPFIDKVDKITYLGIKELQTHLSLKTKDQVTFEITLKPQYRISKDISKAYKSQYDLEDYEILMKSIVTDVVISKVNSIDLEDVYSAKDDIVRFAHSKLTEFFTDYGIDIVSVLSDEPKLPANVEKQANAVIEEKRKMEAAKYQKERILITKTAEAEADGESVKIRMNKLGEARTEYANSAHNAINILVESGLKPTEAAAFLNRIGDNDALVTASRNEANTIIISQGNESVNSDIVGLIESIKNK